MKRIKLILLRELLNGIYQLFSFFCKYDSQLVTLVSNRNDELYGGLRSVYDAFNTTQKYKIKVITFRYHRSFRGRFSYLFYSLKSLYYLSKSSIFILDDYFFPIHCVNKKEKNFVVQIWHAIGHLKKFGLSINKNQLDVIKPHRNYDLAVVNAEEDRKYYAEAFEMPISKVLALGNPKSDVIIKVSPLEHRQGKKFKILYAPTYRSGGMDYSTELINAVLLRFRDSEYIELTISVHPYVTINEKLIGENISIIQDGGVLDKTLSEYELLITDYSSVVFDFSFYERPIVLYTPDLKDYSQKVGFYIPLSDYLDLPTYTSLDNLERNLLSLVGNQEVVEKVRILKNRTFKYTDAKNSKRLVEYIQKIKGRTDAED